MSAALAAAYQQTLAVQERSLLRFLISYTRRTLDPRAVDRTWAKWSTGTALALLAAQDKAFDTAVVYLTDATVTATGDLPSVTMVRPQPNTERLLPLLRITGPVTIKQAAAAGLNPDAGLARALSRTGRFATTVIEDRATDTLWSGMSAEPTCIGYQRIVWPGACARCKKISTTTVFSVEPSRASGGLPAGFFDRHPRCNCTAKPVFSAPRVVDISDRPAPRLVPVDLISERAPYLN
jgi:hypothetical protein